MNWDERQGGTLLTTKDKKGHKGEKLTADGRG